MKVSAGESKRRAKITSSRDILINFVDSVRCQCNIEVRLFAKIENSLTLIGGFPSGISVSCFQNTCDLSVMR